MTNADFKSFGKGERIIYQGQEEVNLHFLLTGQVQMNVLSQTNHDQEVLRLSKGDFFGATALLSREPSSNSVVALSDVDVMILEIEAMQVLIERTPNWQERWMKSSKPAAKRFKLPNRPMLNR